MSTEAKKALRTKIKQSVSALSDSAVLSQSTKAQNIILSLPQYKEASRIGIYLSMPVGEARTDIIVYDALKKGKSVFVPYIYPVFKSESEKSKHKLIDMLRLRSLEEYRNLDRDAWNIPTLPKDSIETRENAMGGKGVSASSASLDDVTAANVEGLDIIIMPGVAFDNKMNRTGHGAGFYDSFLSRFCQGGRRKKPFLAGLCLAEQLLPNGQQLEMHEWDWPVDAVAVGDGRLLTLETSQ